MFSLWRSRIPRDECRKIWPGTIWDILGRIASEGEVNRLLKKTSGPRHIQRIRVHLSELVILFKHEFVNKVKMELQLSQFRVLVNEKSNLQRQVPPDFVFGAFHFEKIVVIKRSTSSEEADVDELADIFTRRVDNIRANF